VADGVKKFTPRLTRQSARDLDSLAQKVDENLLAIQGVSASVSTHIETLQAIINEGGSGGPFPPGTNPSVQYASPHGRR